MAMRAAIMAMVLCTYLQESRNLLVWQEKFGFKKLNSKALKALQSSVPALNYYEDSTLLAKPLKKGSSKQQRSHKDGEALFQGEQQQDGSMQQPQEAQGSSLAVGPLQV
jgi:hypothetical protein